MTAPGARLLIVLVALMTVGSSFVLFNPGVVSSPLAPVRGAADSAANTLLLAELSLQKIDAAGWAAHARSWNGSGNGSGSGNSSGSASPNDNQTIWTDLTPSLNASPSCRSSAGLVYYPPLNYDLLFGGLSGCGPNSPSGQLSDTWTFANGTWTNLTSTLSISPPARFQFDMVYDAYDGYILLFGGNTLSGTLNDTWAWNGSWHQINTGGVAPGPRFHQSEAYDPTLGAVVLYGGAPYGGATQFYSDTWEYRAGVWKDVTAVAGTPPSARRAAPMAYDPATRSDILFGGVDGSGNALGDTWSFNGTWHQLFPLTSPSPRWDTIPLYDPEIGAVVLFGSCSSIGCWSADNDTWGFANGTWVDLTPTQSVSPPARGAAEIAWDAQECEAILFGGALAGRYADTWALTTTNGTGNCSATYPLGNGSGLSSSPPSPSGSNSTHWTNLTAAVTGSPSCRSGEGLAFDPVRNVVLLFGGLTGCVYGVSAATNDTWTYSNGTWTNITATSGSAPSPRFQVDMVYDAYDGYVLLFGGNTMSGTLNDTWAWNGTWWQIPTTVAPPARYHTMETYDPNVGGVVLFGGNPVETGYTYFNDTWLYAGGVWTNITASVGPAPEPRRAGAFAYDPATGYAVLFGGVTPYAQALGDTWALANGTWHQLSFAGPTPSPRWDTISTWDPQANGIVLFGGCTALGCLTADNDTWGFINGTWLNLTPITGPSPSVRGAIELTWDAYDCDVMMFGGANWGRYEETWAFTDSNTSLGCTPNLTFNGSGNSSTGNSSGNGAGNGSGNGSGNSSGNGSGTGSGNGSGTGPGNNSGNSSGNGTGTPGGGGTKGSPTGPTPGAGSSAGSLGGLLSTVGPIPLAMILLGIAILVVGVLTLLRRRAPPPGVASGAP